MTDPIDHIAVIGGTGALGSALAERWAKAGYSVTLGSRDSDRAETAALALSERCGCAVSGLANVDAAARADIIVLAVPWSSHADTLNAIRDAVQGKLVVDTTVPLQPPKVAVVQLPPAGSAAVTARNMLGDEVEVVSAFHNVAATKLATDEAIDGDVLVFGDKKAPRDRVITLAQAAGLRAIHGGALANSAAAEALTSVLISINKRYKSPGAGIRITGI